MTDRPTAYDAVADAYSDAFASGADRLVDPVLEELVGDVRGRDVLSLACGQGRDARLLAQLGATVTAVDVSGEMLRHARRHEAAAPAGITFVQDTAEELGTLAGRTFDAVVCHMALMDIHDLASALESVARVLRDDGRFVFSIVHPCYHGHVQVVADYSTDHRYAKRVRREWLPPHAYHRPISTYVNELACRGLHLERVVEVHHSRADADEGAVPGLFYARARKARRDPIAADSR